MAKTIKFNLICDGNPIRTLEDLQENFSIEDILEYYNSKLLHKWLSVRGYSDELNRVKEITETDSMIIIKKLINIFNIEVEEKRINESVFILQHEANRKKMYDEFKDKSYKVDNVIMSYKKGYESLIESIIKNKSDISIIKTSINEIFERYTWIFVLDHRELFYKFLEDAPIAIFAMLTNEKTRGFFINTESNDTLIKNDSDKDEMFNVICDLINERELTKILGDNLLSFCGQTDSYWKDIEPKNKKFMLLKINTDDYARSSGCMNEKLGYNDVLEKFPILDGIDYMSKSSTQKLLYMEV